MSEGSDNNGEQLARERRMAIRWRYIRVILCDAFMAAIIIIFLLCIRSCWVDGA